MRIQCDRLGCLAATIRAEFSKARFCPKGLLLGLVKALLCYFVIKTGDCWIMACVFFAKFLFAERLTCALIFSTWSLQTRFFMFFLNQVADSPSRAFRNVLTACADGVTRLFDAKTGECQGDFRRTGDFRGLGLCHFCYGSTPHPGSKWIQ